MRVARDAVTPVFAEGHTFEIGKAAVVRDGAGITLISTGVQTSRVVEAAELLAADGVDARVIHLATIKPLDEDALLQLIADEPHVITVEDHSRIGGLGGLLAEIVSERGTTRLTRIGLADHWSESAPNDFLLNKYGLSAAKVAEQIKAGLLAPVG